jgi:hypothetical protein
VGDVKQALCQACLPTPKAEFHYGLNCVCSIMGIVYQFGCFYLGRVLPRFYTRKTHVVQIIIALTSRYIILSIKIRHYRLKILRGYEHEFSFLMEFHHCRSWGRNNRRGICEKHFKKEKYIYYIKNVSRKKLHYEFIDRRY